MLELTAWHALDFKKLTNFISICWINSHFGKADTLQKIPLQLEYVCVCVCVSTLLFLHEPLLSMISPPAPNLPNSHWIFHLYPVSTRCLPLTLTFPLLFFFFYRPLLLFPFIYLLLSFPHSFISNLITTTSFPDGLSEPWLWCSKHILPGEI